MGNCLVTKLKSSVNDDSLLKMGEVVFKVFAGVNYRITLSTYDAFTARGIKGTTFSNGESVKTSAAYTADGGYQSISDTPAANGYIAVSVNYGRIWNITNTVPDDGLGALRYSPSIYKLSIEEIPSTEVVDVTNCPGITNTLFAKYLSGDFAELCKSINTKVISINESARLTGSIASLAGNTKIETLTVLNTGVTCNVADITSLAGTLTSISLTGDKLTATTEQLALFTKLVSLTASYSQNVTGDIANLAACTRLASIYMAYTGVTGSKSSLSGLPSGARDFAGTAVTA